jgi:glycerol-3-phosphate dehydrogenase (NAD(P)+)
MLMRLRVLILGYGEMGLAMEYLLAEIHDVHIWSLFMPTNLEEKTRKAQIILFCLPVNAHVEVIQRVAPCLAKDSLCLTIAKGLDESGKTAAQIFDRYLSDQHRYGVMYGPMLSEEIRLGRFAFADVVLSNADDFAQIRKLYRETRLVCRQVNDMTGSSWSVILKNVYAIMFGVADGLELGDNIRGHLTVTALAEISNILNTLGAESHTPFAYAGLGDLISTATSENSHHHELGRKLANGLFDDISGEGVHTMAMIEKYKLFEYESYPLFTLIRDITSTPDNLKNLFELYLKQLQRW